MENDPVFCDIKTQTFDLKLELMWDEICNAYALSSVLWRKTGGHIWKNFSPKNVFKKYELLFVLEQWEKIGFVVFLVKRNKVSDIVIYQLPFFLKEAENCCLCVVGKMFCFTHFIQYFSANLQIIRMTESRKYIITQNSKVLYREIKWEYWYWNVSFVWRV